MTGQYPQYNRKINTGFAGLAANNAAITATSHECGIHDITYRGNPGCPMCSMERELTQLRGSMMTMRNEMAQLHSENTRLHTQVDIVAAIREAAEVLDDDDLGFLKAVLYEFRDTKSLGIKTTHGSKGKRRGQPAANGFIVMPRQGDPYGHVCSSVGGIAIANYFDEAHNTVGQIKATEMLVKGMSAHLPGGAS